MMTSLQNLDVKILNSIDKHCRTTLLDRIMPIVTDLGNGGIVWIFISLIMFANKKYRTESILVLCSLLLSTITGELIIKRLIRRKRPFTNEYECELLISKPITYSFPSGHTASSFAVVGIFWIFIGPYSLYVTFLALLIAFSRLYLKVHYPSDVLIGMLLGILCSFIVLAVYL